MRGMSGVALRRAFVRGLLLILPLAITVGVLGWLFSVITGFSAPVVTRLLQGLGSPLVAEPWLEYLIPVLGVLLTLLTVVLVGVLGGHYAGRTVLAAFDSLLLRLPLVKWVYGSSRQLMDALSATGSGAFREVVFVEYPRRGLWCLGFVTAPAPSAPSAYSANAVPEGVPGPHGLRNAIYVFLPTTPNPTSGYTVVVDRSEALPAGMTVEDGLKLIVSGGFIAPAALHAQDGAAAPVSRRLS